MAQRLTAAERDVFRTAALSLLAAKERVELATEQAASGPSSTSLNAGATEATRNLLQVVGDIWHKKGGVSAIQFGGLLYVPMGQPGKLETLWIIHCDEIEVIE